MPTPLEYQLKLGGGSAFAAGMAAAREQSLALAGSLRSQVVGALGGVAAALGAGMSARWFSEGIKSAFEAGSELNRLSTQTGQTATDLLKLERAGRAAGIGNEAMAGMVNRLQASLSGVNDIGEKTDETFAAIGVSVEKMRGMTAVQQFEAIRKGLAGIASQEDKIKVLRNLFGREGAAMLPMFASADKIGAPLSAGAALLAKNAETFHRVSVELGQTGNVVKGFFTGVADKVAPVLLPLLDRFNKIDLSKYGQQIGNVIGVLAEAFKEGKLGELLGLSLKVGFMTAVDFFAGALGGTVKMFAGMIGPVAALIADFLYQGGATGLALGFEAAVAKFAAAFLSVFKEPLSYLWAAFEKICQMFGEGIVAAVNMIADSKVGKALGVEHRVYTDQKSFDEMRQSYLDQSDSASGVFRGQASSDWKLAKERLTDGFKSAMPILQMGIQKAGEDFREGKGSLNFFGDDVAKGQQALSDLYNGFVAKLPKSADESKKSLASIGAEAAANAGNAGKKVEADAMAKVGLFVNGASAANDKQKNIADNTAKLVTLFQRFVDRGAAPELLNA